MSEIKKCRVWPGRRFRPRDFDPSGHGKFSEPDAAEETAELIKKIGPLQERLYAEQKRSLLIVLQAMDTAGKDGTIRHVMSGINPQGCVVTSFKIPTPEERSRDFLWRVHQHVPSRGMIGIFNRSHYEDVLITRVHKMISKREAVDRFHEINDFERLLSNSGTKILKFYLLISKDEQRRRLQERLDDPAKRWKFSDADLAERRFWARYSDEYADAITATSTKHAPWHVIPANHKWYRNYLVAKIIAAALKEMDPRFPVVRPTQTRRRIR